MSINWSIMSLIFSHLGRSGSSSRNRSSTVDLVTVATSYLQESRTHHPRGDVSLGHLAKNCCCRRSNCTKLSRGSTRRACRTDTGPSILGLSVKGEPPMLTEVKLDGTELPDVKTDVPGPRSISLGQRLLEHESPAASGLS